MSVWKFPRSQSLPPSCLIFSCQHYQGGQLHVSIHCTVSQDGLSEAMNFSHSFPLVYIRPFCAAPGSSENRPRIPTVARSLHTQYMQYTYACMIHLSCTTRSDSGDPRGIKGMEFPPFQRDREENSLDVFALNYTAADTLIKDTFSARFNRGEQKHFKG